MPKIDIVSSFAAGVLEIAALVLAFHGFAQLRSDIFPVSNQTADPIHRQQLLPYAAGFACSAGVVLGNAALFDIWFPLVRGHGSGVSKFVSCAVNPLKVLAAGLIVAWAVPSVLISTFFAEDATANSTESLCYVAYEQCSRAASVAVEACASCFLILVSIVAHCCGSCRFCPGKRVKFTDVMIKSSTGPMKNFAWVTVVALGVAGMATQLVLAWMATDDDLDVNGTADSHESWTEIPWVVRGLSLGSAALVLFAVLCDIMVVALAADRVQAPDGAQKQSMDHVSAIAWVLKAGAMCSSAFCAVCVSLDYASWSDTVSRPVRGRCALKAR